MTRITKYIMYKQTSDLDQALVTYEFYQFEPGAEKDSGATVTGEKWELGAAETSEPAKVVILAPVVYTMKEARKLYKKLVSSGFRVTYKSIDLLVAAGFGNE